MLFSSVSVFLTEVNFVVYVAEDGEEQSRNGQQLSAKESADSTHQHISTATM